MGSTRAAAFRRPASALHARNKLSQWELQSSAISFVQCKAAALNVGMAVQAARQAKQAFHAAAGP